jgi:pyruvate formate lyase activating enzyme
MDTPDTNNIKEAMYYEKLTEKRVRCKLCFRECIINEGKRGICRNRENRGGTLYLIVYGIPSAIQVDPVEKEPQHHLLPGSLMLCFGTAGCNFRCKFCHNAHLSQTSLEELGCSYRTTVEEAVNEAVKRAIPIISFTYNEPTSFYEYALDIAKKAKKRGIKILWHSNGSMNPEPLKELLRYTDAVTIDLKAFTEIFYRTYCSAHLAPVLRTLQIIKEHGVWCEIVNLLITGKNDLMEDIEQMCLWISKHCGTGMPLHFSRFYPSHNLKDCPPTPVKTLEVAYGIARKAGLEYVMLGNVPGHRYNSTFCPSCGSILVHRSHFDVLENNIEDGCCRFCGKMIPGIWK